MEMPNIWINRTLEKLFQGGQALSLFPVWLLLGPRQAGKSALLKRCALAGTTVVDLDDLDTRTRANRDPALFSAELKLPLFVDEIQYAPTLLSPIKQLADRGCAAGAIRVTGSQNFEVMVGVRETLAGRVAILNLLGLADEEKGEVTIEPRRYFSSILSTSFPRLQEISEPSARELYLASYVSTYVEKDIRELLGVEKRREFEIFIKICALRTGQVVNYDEMARDAGISAVTAKHWLGILEDSFLIKLVHPYFTNRTKRLIKSPKLYFLDMGLAAYLAGWRDSEMLRLGPMAGSAFETHVFGQIYRYFRHRAREAEVSFWRTRDGQEIDFLVETGGRVFPVEVKLGAVGPGELAPLPSIRERNWEEGTVLSLTATKETRVSKDWRSGPPSWFPWGQ